MTSFRQKEFWRRPKLNLEDVLVFIRPAVAEVARDFKQALFVRRGFGSIINCKKKRFVIQRDMVVDDQIADQLLLFRKGHCISSPFTRRCLRG